MSLLSQRAKERGRNAIVKRISKGVLTIEAIEELRDEYEAKKRVAMGRIRVALTARQMSVRYAIDTLSETLDIELEREFCELKKASSSAKDLVQSFPKSELDEANTAIRNLKSLLVQIDFYSSIPSRCRRLRSLLRAAPHRYLKAVYKRAMELENWHSALNREVSAAADKARQGLYKDVDLSALVSILGSHFADVSRLVAEVFEALHDTLDADISEVAKTSPERLVACAEVVEMHELLQRRLVEDARRDASRFADGDETTAIEKLLASPGGAPSRDDALKRLYDAARRRAARMFAEHQMRLADEEYSQTSALVGAATKLVVDLDAIRKHAAPCVPEAEWQLVRVIRAAYEAHVERQLSPLWQLDERLDVGDLIQVAEWLQRYNAVISRVDPTSASADQAAGYAKSDELCTLMLCSPRRPTLLDAGVSAAFRESADRLMRLYLDRITKQVESWFASIRHREAALRRDQRGRWLTSRPEDMFQIIGTQIAVAKEHTERASKANPAHATSHLATVCLRCLEQLRSDALRSIDKAQACSDAVDDYLLRGLRLARTNGSVSFEAPELDGVRRVESSTVMEAASAEARDETRQLKPEQLCAMANDALRVQDRTDALVSEEVRPILGNDNAALASVESVSSDVVADYGHVALAACSAAAAVPFVDLRDVVFVAARAPGSEQWQNWPDDEADTVDVALETLEDYLTDYKTWLPEVLFPRLLRAVFDRLLKAYVDAFLRSDAPFEDSDAVAQLLLRDQNKILQYFLPKLDGDDDDDDGTGASSATGLRDAKAVASALAIMRDLADIVAAQPPHLPQYAVQRLIADFGTDSHAVLLSLVARHPATKAANIISTSTRRNQLLNQCKQLLQTTIATMPDGPTLATKLPSRFAPFKSDLRVNAPSDTTSGSDPGGSQSGSLATAN